MYHAAIAHTRVFDFFNREMKKELSDAGVEYSFIHPNELNVDRNVKVLIAGEMAPSDLTRFPKLEAVMVPFAAINQLDLAALRARNIRVFNTSAHAKFVAERALVLTLAVMGKIVSSHKKLETGNWSGRVNGDGTEKEWSSLFGKNVAIYGYGTIGKSLRKLLAPFDADIGILQYKDRKPTNVKNYPTLSDLAEWCDVFIVCAPVNEQTLGSINEIIFEQLRDKVLINVARGEIIDETALFESLNGNELNGFGSDVWYSYPTADKPNCAPSKYPLEDFDHVVMTPHNGGSVKSADRLKYTDIAQQLVRISKGDFSQHVG